MITPSKTTNPVYKPILKANHVSINPPVNDKNLEMERYNNMTSSLFSSLVNFKDSCK